MILSLINVLMGACGVHGSRVILQDWEAKRAIVETGGRTTAVIASASTSKNRTHVTYRYVVNGRTHCSSGSLGGRVAVGAKCPIAYDAREPSRSLLLAEWNVGGAAAGVVLRVIAYGAIAIGLVLFIREARRLQLWRIGTEVRADIIRDASTWRYRYTTLSRVHTSAPRSDLAFEIDRRVPILYDPQSPSRSMPVTGAMLSRDVVEAVASSAEPMLSPAPRRENAAWVRRHGIAAAVAVAAVLGGVGFVMLVSGVSMPVPLLPMILGAVMVIAGACVRNQALTLYTQGQEVKAIATSSMRQKDGGQMLSYRYVVDGCEYRGCGAVPRDGRALCDPRTPSVVVVLVHPSDPRRSRLVLADEG